MTNTEWLRSRILSRVITTPIGQRKESLEYLRLTQWSALFEKLMRNRLLFGVYRYGLMGKKKDYDNVGSAVRRLNLYMETGNLEHLVDVVNLCLIEFVHGTHPKKHFQSTDETDEHAKPGARY